MLKNLEDRRQIKDAENKIPDASNLVTSFAFNTKIGEIENKI